MSSTRRHPVLIALGTTFLLGLLGLAPAAAEDASTGESRRDAATADAAARHAAGRSDDGDTQADTSAAYTEDDDTNDGGTPDDVADDGDNRHPSGRDRSVEGSAGTQGRSASDPDDDGRGPDRSNGGPDKPNGAGGTDLADQDGNNGCGNDDDFEDDNEGWCGHKPKPAVHATTADRAEQRASAMVCEGMSDDVTSHATQECEAEGEAASVLGAHAERAATAVLAATAEDTPVAAAGTSGAQVLGAAASAERPSSATAEDAGVEGELPLTGAMIVTLLGAAAAAFFLGVALLRASRGRAARVAE